MSNHRKKSAATADDVISELPDEILHSILRRLSSSREAAITTVLSRRWRSPWRSYPFVVFDFRDLNNRGEAGEISSTAVMAQLRQFGDATLDRFSGDQLLLMKTLKVVLEKGDSTIYSSVVNQLLNLAVERKAEVIAIIVTSHSHSHRLILQFGLLSNSAAKSLRFEGIEFTGGCLPLSLNSLRTVYLDYVKLENSQLLGNLIASSPILETLILRHISILKKLQIRNTTSSLKTLKISYCSYMEEIEIAAAGLQTLYIRELDVLRRIELIAPQLAVLKIVNFHYMGESVLARVSKLKSVKSLTLGASFLIHMEKKLKLSIPNLEEFTFWAPIGLEEIELESMPGLQKFILHCCGRVPDEVKISEVGSAYTAATNGWKVNFGMLNDEDTTVPWFVGLKNFVTTFTQFNKVNVHWYRSGEIIFEEADNVLPRAIDYLKIDLESCSSNDQRVLLDGLFWACHPRFLTIVHHEYNGSEKLTEVFSDLTSKYLLQRFSEDVGEDVYPSWLHQLRDVKMVLQLKDGKTIMPDTEMVKKYVQEEGEGEYEHDSSRVRTYFELTWYYHVQ
ncbi:Putative F-box/FBD/LRR-repeat protein At5g56810 [Linum perenne]